MNYKHRKRLSRRFYKELAMSALALMSVFLVVYEFAASPDQSLRRLIARFDLLVALVFLTDFCVLLARAPDKKQYVITNWYMLLSSIPIIDSWVELLRGLRLLELVRLVRTGSHLTYVYEAITTKDRRRT